MNKDVYIKKFIPLVFKYAPKYEYFSVYDLHKIIPLNESELISYKKYDHEIKCYLINNDYAERKGSNNIQLLEKGINYFEDLKSKELEDEISKLTKENLKLQNSQLKKHILFSIISFIFGAIVTNIKDILNLLNIKS